MRDGASPPPREVMTLSAGSEDSRASAIQLELDLVLRARRVITPSGEVAAEVGVRHGVVVVVSPWGAGLRARETVDVDDACVVIPGLVDTHVHINEPGHEDWEGFETGTRAALDGGVTTLVDMPLDSSPPTTNVSSLGAKLAAAGGKCFVDVGFWGGIVPTNIGTLSKLQDAGVLGFKCFLADSGNLEFPRLAKSEFEAAAREVAALESILLVHAEDESIIQESKRNVDHRYRTFLESRPARAEVEAVSLAIDVARRTGVRMHIVHVSTGDAAAAVMLARREGVQVTAETTPHYLALCAEQIEDGSVEYKCCPPIRAANVRESLWDALKTGAISSIASDHSPGPPRQPESNYGSFSDAWGGVSSIQLSLSVVWTQARVRGIPLSSVIDWMATQPALLSGLANRGRIEVGCKAHLVAFAPDEQFTVDPTSLHQRCKRTPYSGRSLVGMVRRIWMGGHEVTGGSRRAGLPVLRGGSEEARKRGNDT